MPLPAEEMERLLREMPKVELHVHLDGAMRPSTLWSIARAKGMPKTHPDEAAFRSACICREGATLPEFLEKFALMVPIVAGDAEAVRRIAYEFCQDKASEGVVYAEARYAPQLLTGPGVTAGDIVEAVASGFDAGRRDFGVDVRSILCCMRRMASGSAEVVDLCIEYRDRGVVGIDLAGDESVTDPEHPEDPAHVEAFRKARQHGIHRTVHAAESGPAWNAWQAVEVMGAERIGHCYHVLDDPEIYRLVRDRGVHIEVCPTSSLETGSVALGAGGWPSHPATVFAKDGANFGVNTDDPTVCGVGLVDEFRVVAVKMGAGLKTLVAGVRNAAGATFLGEEEKKKLVEKIEGKLKELGLA